MVSLTLAPVIEFIDFPTFMVFFHYFSDVNLDPITLVSSDGGDFNPLQNPLSLETQDGDLNIGETMLGWGEWAVVSISQ